MNRRSTLVGVLVVVLWCALGGGLGFAAGGGGHGGGGFGGGFGGGGHGGFSGGHGGFSGGRGGPEPGGRGGFGGGFGGGGHFDGNRARGEFGHQDFSRGHFPNRGDFHFHARRPGIFLYPYDPYYPGSLDDPYCDGDLRYYDPRYCSEVPSE